jgi:hypothetical protein
MTKVWFVDAKGARHEVSFASRGEAARFVKGCIKSRIKANIITQEVLAGGRLGGYAQGVNALIPVHCM